ncbi:MAG: DUF4332 domain-containing protein [Candidatus Thermoplasmatota archaeon]|nr:DUF4332 domain-containing protein [Candidatus Thermoplasmatota archaeon]
MDVTSIKGIGRQYGKKLSKAGVKDVASLRNIDIEQTAKKTGIPAERLEEWQQRAREMQLLTDISGIGPTYSRRLHGQGITTPEELAAADICATAKDIDVSEKRLEKWVERARSMVEAERPRAKKAVVAETIGPDNASIHIKGDTATVTIKGTIHERVPVFRGDGMEGIAQEQKIAVNVDSAGDTRLWFNGQWHINVPAEKEGFLDKVKRMLGI